MKNNKQIYIILVNYSNLLILYINFRKIINNFNILKLFIIFFKKIFGLIRGLSFRCYFFSKHI